MKTLKFLLVIYVFIASVTAMAQKKDITLNGAIINEADGNPVEYASVALYSLPDSNLVDGTVTDSLGYFVLKNCSPDSAYLKIGFIGYENKYVSGILLNKKEKEKDVGVISIRQSSISLNELTVSSERDVVTYKIDKKVVTLNALPNAGSGTAADALENVPGISRDAEGNITVRGSSNFTVLIDGKPSLIPGNDLLKQLSASTIESIEVITNPSVKYSPDGTSGVLNIIMKKDKNNGVSGIINGSASTNDKYSGDFSLSVNKTKWKIFINPAYQNRIYLNKKTSELITNDNDTTRTVICHSEPFYKTEGLSLRTGFDYNLTEKVTLTYAADMGTFIYDRVIGNHFTESNSANQAIKYTLYENDFGWGGHYFMNYINLQKKLKGENHELNIMALYSSWKGNGHQNTSQFITDGNFLAPENNSGQLINFLDNDKKNRLRFTVDYSKPFGKDGSIEAGLQTDLSSKNREYSFTIFDTLSGDWYVDSLYSNQFSFPENIYSAYLTCSYKILGVQVLAGIRPEYYERDLLLDQTNQHFTFTRFGLYPSLHLSKEFPKEFTLQASYSQRTNRPGEMQLNPVPYYMDTYFRRIGNPSLEPEYIDSYELNTQKTLNTSTLSAEFYYRQTNNKFDYIRSMQNGILVENPVNINKDYSLGGELSAKIQIKSWWSVSPSAELFYYKFQGVPDVNISEQESNVFSTRVNTRIKITSTSTLQLTHYWYGSQKTASGESGASWVMNASFKQELLKKNLSLTLLCTDIFSTDKIITTISQPGYYYRETTAFYSPSFFLSISYNFNNYTAAQQRSNSVVPLM
jgi:outer membrane receptor protein involved in Fe transport